MCRRTPYITARKRGCTYDNCRTIPLFCSSGTTRHGERAGDYSPPYLPRRQPFQSGSACSLMYGKIKEYDFVSISQRAHVRNRSARSYSTIVLSGRSTRSLSTLHFVRACDRHLSHTTGELAALDRGEKSPLTCSPRGLSEWPCL